MPDAPSASNIAPPGGRRARAAATEAALKEAATRVFDRLGYLNTKITDITAEAGRAAGSFYNHFAGKHELLEALLADVQDAGDRLAALHPTDHDLSDREQLRFHIAGYWHTFRQHRSVFVALGQAAMVDAGFAERLRELIAPDLRIMRDHLRYLVDHGIELPGDPELVAIAMTGMWNQFAMDLLSSSTRRPDRDVDDDEAIDLLTTMTMRGIAGTPPAGPAG